MFVVCGCVGGASFRPSRDAAAAAAAQERLHDGPGALLGRVAPRLREGPPRRCAPRRLDGAPRSQHAAAQRVD